jgi:hypothetical protein
MQGCRRIAMQQQLTQQCQEGNTSAMMNGIVLDERGVQPGKELSGPGRRVWCERRQSTWLANFKKAGSLAGGGLTAGYR